MESLSGHLCEPGRGIQSAGSACPVRSRLFQHRCYSGVVRAGASDCCHWWLLLLCCHFQAFPHTAWDLWPMGTDKNSLSTQFPTWAQPVEVVPCRSNLLCLTAETFSFMTEFLITGLSSAIGFHDVSIQPRLCDHHWWTDKAITSRRCYQYRGCLAPDCIVTGWHRQKTWWRQLSGIILSRFVLFHVESVSSLVRFVYEERNCWLLLSGPDSVKRSRLFHNIFKICK